MTDDGDDDTVKGAAAAPATAEPQEDASAPGTTADSSKNSNNDSNNDSGSAGVGQNGQTQYKPNGGATQTIADAAAYYHDKRGWQPVPVSRRTKKPFEKEWQNLPYSPERFTQHKALNVSIQLGPRSGNLVDVDLDSKEALEYADYFLPDTNGMFGRASKPRSHRLYIADFSFEGEKAVIQFKDGDAMIVELRIGAGGKGAQSVAPPSVNGSGETIEWVNDQPTPVDDRVLKHAVTKLAVVCLLAPRYPQRGSRHEAALVLGGVFARAGWSAEEIEILVALVARKAGSSAWDAHGKTAAGAVAVMATGKPVSGLNRLCEVWGEDVAKAFTQWGIVGNRHADTTEPGSAAATTGTIALADLNKKYCVVVDGGRTRVMYFDRFSYPLKDGEYHTRDIPVFLTFEDFRNYYCNRYVPVIVKKGAKKEPTETEIPIGSWWLAHRQRRQYDGLIFLPGGEQVINKRLNLWRGWGAGVEPIEGDWSLMEAHIRNIIADGNTDKAEYLLNWCAWMFQNMVTPPEAAPVLRGPKGIGKGTLGNALCKMLGQHAVHISSINHLTGKFNAHFRDAVFLFADEAFWPGHRSEEGTLNQLITEPDLFIEAKRKDGVMVRNMLHIMLASNAEWNVPAGANERRYVIYDVSDKVMQNKVYFDALNEQLKNGGLNAMLFALLHWELKGFHPRQIPKPDASMAHQQLQTLLPLEAWWADLLETARPWGNSRDNPHLVISEGYDEVEEYCAGPGSMLPSTRRTKKRLCLYDQARASSPRLRNTNYNEIAAFLRKQGGVSRKVLGRRGWYLPPLQDCRRKWMEKYPAWEWQDKSITDWEPEVTEEPSSVKEADVSFRDAFEPKPPPLDPK